MLALQPNLESLDIGPLLGTFVGVGLVIAVAWLVARFLLPGAFRLVAKSPELVVTIALGWCFGLGMFAGQLGPWASALGLPVQPSVSMELGALIAGTSIATFPYAHEVVAKVGNLRDFFITLFFVLHDLQTSHPDLVSDTLVVDFNVAIHDHIRARGARVVYGDIANPSTLQGAKLTDAHVIVCTIPDDILKGINNLELTRQLRPQRGPRLNVIASQRSPCTVTRSQSSPPVC